MNIAVFVTIWSAGISSADLNDHFSGSPLSYLKAVKAVHAVEMYTPEPGDVPVMDDVPAPAIIIQIDMETADAADTLVKSEKFQQTFMDKSSPGPGIEKINLEVTEAVHFPLAGKETPPPRTAPLSFVVRYYGPVKDLNQFVDFYTTNHPPILAKFEGIRNVLCYLPMNWRTSGEVVDESLIIGNEVVFDDLATFKAALATEVLEEAMEDTKHFQNFGYSTHHTMHRKRVYTREE